MKTIASTELKATTITVSRRIEVGLTGLLYTLPTLAGRIFLSQQVPDPLLRLERPSHAVIDFRVETRAYALRSPWIEFALPENLDKHLVVVESKCIDRRITVCILVTKSKTESP